jgi:hypothetical protein
MSNLDVAKASRDRVIDMLGGLAEVLGVEVSAERIVGYVCALDGLSADAIAQACKRAARECVFFPRPAELRALAAVEAPTRHPVTIWPAGWQAHCPHAGSHVIPTQCPEAWDWVRATVLEARS